MNRTTGITRRLLLAAVLLLAAPAFAKAGAYKDLGGAWDNVAGVAALNGKLYIISGGHLWATGTDGKYKDLGAGWDKVGGAAGLNGKLYAVSGGHLWATETK